MEEDEPPRRRPERVERPPPPDTSRIAITERLARIVTGLTIQNVLTIAMLVLIAVPVWLIYRLGNDKTLREQFLSSVRIVEGMGVPCLVIASQLVGQVERYSVIAGYETDGRMEFGVAVRSQGIMSGPEIAKACDKAREHAGIVRRQVGHPSESK